MWEGGRWKIQRENEGKRRKKREGEDRDGDGGQEENETHTNTLPLPYHHHATARNSNTHRDRPLIRGVGSNPEGKEASIAPHSRPRTRLERGDSVFWEGVAPDEDTEVFITR